jgi:hypothetical protein
MFWITLTCAAIVRFVGLFAHSTGADEAFTFYVSAHRVPVILHLVRTQDFHPPLIYLIGNLLMQVTRHAWLFRIVTALFGVMGAAATYALAVRLLGGWGPIAALLAAINPSLAYFDGYFRMYALLWSLAMLSWACLLWAMDEPQRPRRWVAYGAVLAALVYTQYLAFFTVIAQICYVAFARRRTAGFWVACAAALLAFAPWAPALALQYPLGGTAYNTVLNGQIWRVTLMAPSFLLVDGIPESLEFAKATLAIFDLVAAGGLLIAFVQRRWALLALCLPLVLQVAFSLVSGKLLLGGRYLLQGIVPLTLVCILLCSWLAARRLRVLALALVCALATLELAGTVDKHFLAPYQPVDWGVYRQFLDAKIHKGDAIVLDSSMVYYVLVGTPAITNRPVYLIGTQEQAKAFAQRAAKIGRVWYVGYETELPDPNGEVFKSLLRTHPRHASWVTTDAAYGDVVLTTLFLPPSSDRKE